MSQPERDYMTDMDKTVRRKTVQAYRVTITSATPSPDGRKLVVELTNNGSADLIRIREAHRRKWIEFDVAELYRKGLLATVRAQRKRK